MSGRRLVIAIDCDDVLVPSAQDVITAYNNQFGTDLTLTDWYKPVTYSQWGTSEEGVAIARVHEYMRSFEHAQLIPDPKAVMAVRELVKHHELHLVTGRPEYMEATTMKMLGIYFPGYFQSIEHTNFHAVGDKKSRTKGEVCAQIGANILIDDHIVHGESVIEAGVQRVMVFGDYPWNRREALPRGMVRCYDWKSVLREIDEFAKQ